MDGRSKNPLTICRKLFRISAAMIAVAAFAALPMRSHAQAMGKATVDTGSAGADGSEPGLMNVAQNNNNNNNNNAVIAAPALVPQTPEVRNTVQAAPVTASASEKPAEPKPQTITENPAPRAESVSTAQPTPASVPAPTAPASIGSVPSAVPPIENPVPAAQSTGAEKTVPPPIAPPIHAPTAAIPAPENPPAKAPIASASPIEPAPAKSTSASIEDQPIRSIGIKSSAGILAAQAATQTGAPAVPGAQKSASEQTATNTSATSGLWAGLKNFSQVAAAMAIVIGLIFIGRGLAKKFVPGAKAGAGKGVIEILARHPLAKNQSIVLVRIGSQIVALSQGRETSESILVINDGAEVAKIIGQIEGKQPHSSQAGFTKLFANARMDLEQSPADSDPEIRDLSPDNLDEQLDEMAAAKRQLMELRQHVRTVRDRLPKA